MGQPISSKTSQHNNSEYAGCHESERHTDLLLKAPVKQAIRLVQHQPAQLLSAEGLRVLQVVQQPQARWQQAPLLSCLCEYMTSMVEDAPIFCSKPRSSRRSASSRTSQRSSSVWKDCVFCRWSSSRPGVATSTVTPLRSRAFSFALFSPPCMLPPTCRQHKAPPQWFTMTSIAEG